jgi:hypothetical protein
MRTVDDQVLTNWKYRRARYRYFLILVSASIASQIFVWQGSLAVGLICICLFLIYFPRNVYLDDIYFINGKLFQKAAQVIGNITDVNPEINYVGSFYGVNAREPFLVASDGSKKLIITPARFWSYIDGVDISGRTSSLMLDSGIFQLQVMKPTSGDIIVRKGWLRETKYGNRDRRFKNNPIAYWVFRYVIVCGLGNGSKWEFVFSKIQMRDAMIVALNEIIGAKSEKPNETKANQPDDREAVRLCQLAADQGDAVAQFNLGRLYEEGRGGLPKDDREAVRLYQLAAAQRNRMAQVYLGISYHLGRGGLPKDDREAARLFKLGTIPLSCADWPVVVWRRLLNISRKTPQKNRSEFKLAANEGNVLAQVCLGHFYAHGLGGRNCPGEC